MIEYLATNTLVVPFFIAIAIFMFAFVFWRDATKEGFSSDKILDTFVLSIMFGFLGGKLLFRHIDLNYLRYEFLSSPIILEGVLVGGFVAIYIQVIRNGWEGAKVGDMVAPALSLFQAVTFLGVYLTTLNLQNFILFSLFFLLYVFIRFLKLSVNLGRSANYFERIRLNKVVFTGGLLATYLILSSLIAISFLLYNINSIFWFWWFQLLFYLIVFSLAVIFVKSQIVKPKSNIFGMDIKHYLTNKLNLINYLQNKKKQLKKDRAILSKEEKTLLNSQSNVGQQNAELGDDVTVKGLQDEISRSQQIVREQNQEIDDTLGRLKSGKYGTCQRCGRQISQERLQAYPYAKYCIACQTEIDGRTP